MLTLTCAREAIHGTSNARHRFSEFFWLVLLLLPVMHLRVHAQTFNLQTDREPVTSLDGLWRFHTGDNPQWASPSFDDSQWPLIRSGTSWTEQGYFTYSGYAWYRFTIQVADGSKPLSLLLPRIYTGYQVYGNGKLIGGSGSIIPTPPQLLPPTQGCFGFCPEMPGRKPSRLQSAYGSTGQSSLGLVAARYGPAVRLAIQRSSRSG